MLSGFFGVGMTGLEPAASSSRTKRATGLRYIPKIFGQRKYVFPKTRMQKYGFSR